MREFVYIMLILIIELCFTCGEKDDHDHGCSTKLEGRFYTQNPTTKGFKDPQVVTVGTTETSV